MTVLHETFQRAIGHHQAGRLEAAQALYTNILSHDPQNVDCLHLSGVIAYQTGRFPAAAAMIAMAIVLDCRHAAFYSNLGLALHAQGKFSGAIAQYRRAVTIIPRYPEAQNNFGNALQALRQSSEAVARYRLAIDFCPDYAEAYNNLANALEDQGLAEQAIPHYRAAIRLKPDYAEAYNNLGVTLTTLGRLPEALESYDNALRLKPDYVEAHSSKIQTLDFMMSMTFREHQAERRNWHDAHAAKFSGTAARHVNLVDTSRRLTVGYVSANFNVHSASYVFGSVIRAYNHADFKVICYSGTIGEDARTEEFRRSADKWRITNGLSDDAMAAQIRADGVDILVDLSGHTDGHRLLVFARKPAPIQLCGPGNPSGTGISTIDYLFSDPVLIPQAARALFAEQIYDLPCVMAFQPPDFDLPVSPLPALNSGYVTFGCLNRFSKVNAAMLELWAKILLPLSGSALFLKDRCFDEPARRTHVLNEMARYGIDGSRITFQGRTSRRDHLLAYGNVDIALDPFPQGGGVTTLESVWMGVPVISRLGDSVPSRMSGAVLSGATLGDWVVATDTDYLNLAIERASNLESLARLRHDLRVRFSNSAAGNIAQYTQAVEDAYRKMWKTWCQSQEKIRA